VQSKAPAKSKYDQSDIIFRKRLSQIRDVNEWQSKINLNLKSQRKHKLSKKTLQKSVIQYLLGVARGAGFERRVEPAS